MPLFKSDEKEEVLEPIVEETVIEEKESDIAEEFETIVPEPVVEVKEKLTMMDLARKIKKEGLSKDQAEKLIADSKFNPAYIWAVSKTLS